jgi:hypothetical protein
MRLLIQAQVIHSFARIQRRDDGVLEVVFNRTVNQEPIAPLAIGFSPEVSRRILDSAPSPIARTIEEAVVLRVLEELSATNQLTGEIIPDE